MGVIPSCCVVGVHCFLAEAGEFEGFSRINPNVYVHSTPCNVKTIRHTYAWYLVWFGFDSEMIREKCPISVPGGNYLLLTWLRLSI